MPIIFAAPFVLAAGIAFTILSLIPRARPWAIPIPTGIIAAGPSLLAVLIVEALALHFFDHTAWPGRWAAILYLSSGINRGVVGGGAAVVLASFAARTLPMLVLRIAIIFAGCSSYFVVIALSMFAIKNVFELHSPMPSGWSQALAPALEVLLSFIGAFLISSNPDQFRGQRIHLPHGVPFRERGPAPPTPPAPDAP